MDTRLHNALCVQHREAITLWCLATCGEYRTIGHLFGVARSTVCVIVHGTCGAIVNVFKSQYIQFPTGANLQQVVDGFESKCQMIQRAGAIDGCHIRVKPPTQNHTDFYNRKGWYSIVLQGVVNHNYLFTDVMVGWPGSGVHDVRVLANSHLYCKAINKEMLNSSVIKILGKDIFPFLLGDSAYPLSMWLMKLFPHNSLLSDSKKTFNYKLSRAQIVVENAFVRLKSRWRRLMNQNNMDVSHVPYVVTTCCILHNVCEIDGDTFVESWLERTQLDEPTSSANQATKMQAKDIRHSLVDYFNTQH